MEWKKTDNLVEYPAAIDHMERRVAAILSGNEPEQVWLVEHPPLYTGGTSATDGDLRDEKRFPTYHTGRGGQWTYHGPGQRVAYVMLNLKQRALPGEPDIRAYVQNLENWVIATLADYGVEGFIREGRVGVWVKDKSGSEAKIAAIGIRVRKWVTYHGICLNVHPDLSHYNGIVPCGISNFGVTSLHALGIKADMSDVDAKLKHRFTEFF